MTKDIGERFSVGERIFWGVLVMVIIGVLLIFFRVMSSFETMVVTGFAIVISHLIILETNIEGIRKVQEENKDDD